MRRYLVAAGGLRLPHVKVEPRALVIDQRLFAYAAAAACIPLALLVYWTVVDDFFVWDDFFFLRAVRNHGFPTVMARAFTFPQGKLFDEATAFWRPSIDLYFFLAKPLGIHPQPYHLVNIALHGLVGSLAVVFVWRLSRSLASGVVTGLLFTVAPTYDFAVSWIAQVSELLGAVLMLAVLILYRAYLTDERPRPYLVATGTLFVLALLTKESTVILAALLPALSLTVPPSELRRSSLDITRSLIPVIVAAVLFWVAMEVHEYSQPGHLQSIGLHMARNLWRYLKWMVLPYELSVGRPQ